MIAREPVCLFDRIFKDINDENTMKLHGSLSTYYESYDKWVAGCDLV